MRTAFLASLAVLALAAMLAMRAQPAAVAGLTSCPFRDLTGLPCPTCGTMHALDALGRGDLRAALGANPLATGALLLLVPATVASACRRRRLDLSSRARRLLILGVVGVVALNWSYLILSHRDAQCSLTMADDKALAPFRSTIERGSVAVPPPSS